MPCTTGLLLLLLHLPTPLPFLRCPHPSLPTKCPPPRAHPPPLCPNHMPRGPSPGEMACTAAQTARSTSSAPEQAAVVMRLDASGLMHSSSSPSWPNPLHRQYPLKQMQPYCNCRRFYIWRLGAWGAATSASCLLRGVPYHIKCRLGPLDPGISETPQAICS